MVDHPRLVLATTILAFVDGSVVNLALPAIGESLGAGPRACNGSSRLTVCRSARSSSWAERWQSGPGVWIAGACWSGCSLDAGFRRLGIFTTARTNTTGSTSLLQLSQPPNLNAGSWPSRDEQLTTLLISRALRAIGKFSVA
jgi:hypothetical protein